MAITAAILSKCDSKHTLLNDFLQQAEIGGLR